jgi:hypothetical protein
MRKIKLTQGKYALVNDKLFPSLNKFKWHALKRLNTYYALRDGPKINGRRARIRMHREVFRLKGLSVPREVDHRDRNGLNNQFKNLRNATKQLQTLNRGRRADNTSGYIGVTWNKYKRKWQAQVQLDGHNHNLGRFISKREAAKARDRFLAEHRPECAVMNL